MKTFFSCSGDEDTSICGTGSVACYENAAKKLLGEDVIDELANDTVTMFRENCNCLPGCTAINYEGYMDRIKFDYDRIIKTLGESYSNFSKYENST